ncbi:MAG: PstA family ABC transporter permease, partial [Pseudorhodobacter sp.]
MTDATPNTGPNRQTPSVDWAEPHMQANLRRRKSSELRLRLIGLGAIAIAFAMLALLIGSLVSTGWQAFRQTHVTIQVTYGPDHINPENLARSNYRGLIADTMTALIPSADDPRAVAGILSNGAQFLIRDMIVADPALMGQTVKLTVPVSDPYDQLAKGLIDRDTPEQFRRVKDAEIAAFDTLVEQGLVSKPFNWALFRNADSRFPELAGLQGALWGSFYALLTCFLLSFPIGIGAAIYLEEFAPKSRLSDFIEVNINNLAAVPSVVFGLLALAVFLGWFGLGRSIPFVGGMTLALMTLPTIIIATRAALKAVPPSIREAALG